MSRARHGLDAQVESAWRAFRARLADRLAAMGESESLVVEQAWSEDDELTGAAPYVQFLVGPAGELRAEAVSNDYLDDRFTLTEDGEIALLAMGWQSPGDDEMVAPDGNFHLDAEQRDADRVAALTVGALREVYGCPHPAFLDAAGLERGPHDPPAVAAEQPEPLAVRPVDRDHLQALVDDALQRMFDQPLRHDEDGDIGISCGQSCAFVRVREDHPVVEVFAEVVIDLPDPDAVGGAVEERNRRDFLRQYFVQGDRIMARAVLPALPFAPEQLRLLVTLFCDDLDDVAAELAERTGGRRFCESRRVPSRPEALEDPALVGLLELLHLGPVSPATAAALFDHDRRAIIRCLVEIRTGRLVFADHDHEQVLDILRHTLRAVVEGRARPGTDGRAGDRRRSRQLALDVDCEPGTLDEGRWSREAS